MSELISLLKRSAQGDKQAENGVYQLVYDDLRKLAADLLRREPSGQTLQPTALVNEAYFRLTGTRPTEFEDARHFFGAAANAMRQILIDAARRRGSRKRTEGAYVTQDCLDSPNLSDADGVGQLLDLDAALVKLAEIEPRIARLVELKFFGGLTLAEAAAILMINERTAYYDWKYARAWLLKAMGGSAD